MQPSMPLQPARRRVGPVVTLLLLAPIIVEFLFGSTHVSLFFLILPQIGVYGCGALIIRAAARYRRGGWAAILLMGLAFAVALECLTLQTALASLFVAADPHHIYARAFGVNWLYLLYALGYESIWAIVLPIQVTELLFPERRDDPWLGRWGLALAAVVFLLASAATWYLWDLAVHSFLRSPGYQAPPLTIALVLVAIALLIVVALAVRTTAGKKAPATRRAPRPWLVGLAAFWLSLLWFVLVIFAVGIAPSVSPVAPAAIGFLLAALALALVSRWSARVAWHDTHRVALVSGALYASMLAGVLLSGISLPIDWIGKLVLNALTVVGLIYLARRARRRSSPSPVVSENPVAVHSS